jgi:hypothetical protein
VIEYELVEISNKLTKWYMKMDAGPKYKVERGKIETANEQPRTTKKCCSRGTAE